MALPSDRPEAQLIPIRSGIASPPKPRDPRIDAFRGLALVMIIINHIPGNPWEALTIRNLGFSDAAEAFFVMSGVAAGIAYSPKIGLALSGQLRPWDAIAPLWRRAWTLYSVQILLTIGAIALFAWAADTFYRPEFREMHNLGQIYDDTGAAVFGLVVLGYQIGYVNILPAYILLMILAPAVIAGALYAPRTTLIASLALWLIAGWAKINMPTFPGDGGWFFSPLAWQAIFVIGLMIGIRHRNDERLVPVSWPFFGVCVAFLVFVFAWVHVPGLASVMNAKMAQLGGLGFPSNITSHNKPFLAMPRFVHILAVVYVISCVPAITRMCANRALAPLRLMGAHGLLVFGLGTMLALLGQIVLIAEPAKIWLHWIVPPCAVILCYAAAVIADRARTGSAAALRSRAALTTPVTEKTVRAHPVP